ncbi:hypothetical protein HAALTHF_18640n [Vreelandella aquamarina]|nr:hypothetical protein HAALTHF_18640n [Halomonas axialensis]
MSADVPGVVETSNNLGVLSVEQGRFHLCALVRSLHDSAAQAMAERFQALFGLMGARVKVENGYPGWALTRIARYWPPSRRATRR